MTSLSVLKSRLSRELGDSETINKDDNQRTECLNDACRQIYLYREWPELYVNKTTQAVDGVINIPLDMKIPSILWFGKSSSYGYDTINFVNQTDFRVDNDKTATITEQDGIQTIKLFQDTNRGFDSFNTSTNGTINLNDLAANERLSQSITVEGDTIEGAILKLSKEGSPSGTLTVSLFEESNDTPTGSALATGTLNISELSETEEWFWVKFSSAASVTENTKYVVELKSSYSTDATNYVKWSYHSSSQIDGTRATYGSGVWTTQTGDHGVILCSDYYNFQYVKRFVDMSDPSDDNGLSEDFDQAVVKMAAGIMHETKMRSDKANVKFYGSGNENNPTQNSAFGILNLLWTNKRINSTRQNERFMTVFEKQNKYGLNTETWPYSSFNNLI